MQPNRPASVLTLLVLALNLTACATRSVPVSPKPPQIPPAPPELMLPIDAPQWSMSVRQLFQRWQQMLTQPPQS